MRDTDHGGVRLNGELGAFPDFGNKHLTDNSLWHRIKRRLFARPLLYMDVSNHWMLGWQWRDGTLEIVAEGRVNAGEMIQVPRGTLIHDESA